MIDWIPDISNDSGPAYIAIANAIGAAITAGKLTGGDRLPPQRDIAKRLGIDFTTVARGYNEARKRGLVDTQVGRGTFILEDGATQPRLPSPAVDPRRSGPVDMSMNMPPEPQDSALVDRMKAGITAVAQSVVPLMRYQGFGGADIDKEAASSWLSRRGLVPSLERIFVSPGAHPAMLAILGLLAKSGETVLSEVITYPGIRSIASQLNLSLVGLPGDKQGIDPDSFAAACREKKPKALYLNPTLHNPTTATMTEERRKAVCEIARAHGVPIIEDDAYGFIPERGPPPLAAIAPDITWHIGGLAKCIGAGLRLAFVVAPDAKAAWPYVSSMRTNNVMASPFMAAVATRWIEDGTADALLAFVRKEAADRQMLASTIFPAGSFDCDPLAFNIWLPLTNGWTRSAFLSHLRTTGIGVVGSDAFTVQGKPEEFVRICLGGPISKSQLQNGLEFIAHGLAGPPERLTAFF